MFLRMTPPPHSPQGKGCKLCPGGILGFYRKRCCRNFKNGSFDWKFKGLVPFLIVEIDLRTTNPPIMPTIPPNIFGGLRIELFFFHTRALHIKGVVIETLKRAHSFGNWNG